MYLLVGFADKLRLMNILIDDIRTYKEFSVKVTHQLTLQLVYRFVHSMVKLAQLRLSNTCG